MGEHYIKSSSFLVLLFVAGLIVGGIVSSYITVQQINSLKDEISNLKSNVSKLVGNQTVTIQNITLYQNSTALSEMYERVKDSVVLINGITSEGTVQGSGFVYNFSGKIIVITNYHVVHGTTQRSVTFSNGNGYAALINGTDPYADLAILSVPDAPQNEIEPLKIVSSTMMRVGDPVIAIGNPYGLVGSMTTGVISALGRTISEQEYTGGFMIANIIQTSAPINPGNSGGPLLNYCGEVVGITTAIVENSQGLGFAIPSNTILNELWDLVTYGTYQGHSYLGLEGRDMTYEIAQQMGVNVTYGWRIEDVKLNGPSYGKLNYHDIIIAMNGTRIKNGDDIASYLEEKTLPKQTLIIKVVRGTPSQVLEIPLVLGQKPPPPV